MIDGFPPDRAFAVGTALLCLIQDGLVFSALGLLAFKTANKVTKALGGQPIPTDIFQEQFDMFVRMLLSPVWGSDDVNRSSTRSSQLTTYLGYAAMVVVFSLALELVSLYAVTGFVLAHYKLSGAAVPLTPALNSTVGLIVLITATLMMRGNQLIQQAHRYA